jgi:branched-chain amino acid transport system ATP-binding protein
VLRIEDLRAGYRGGGTVLHGVSLEVAAGGVHAVVGANGAGKTTLIHTIAGLLRPASGRVRVDGRDVTAWPPHRRIRAGLGLVPQGRRVFAAVTVAEHLAIAYRRPAAGRAGWDPGRVLELLPQLAARLRHRGELLSGGEQQMLAIARALLTQPRVLLLDEPTEGLAPALADQIRDLVGKLAADGTAILLAAPHPDLGVAVADRVTVLAAGRVSSTGDAHPAGDADRQRTALAVNPGADRWR